jgi:hypothetical protein
MNKVKNLLIDFDKTWLIFAGKKLSEREKTDAVRNLTTFNREGMFSFVLHKNVVFDIDVMTPLSEADYISSCKESPQVF